MDKLLIIADDLTGACEAAAHFGEKGMSTKVSVKISTHEIDKSDCDVLVINTDSRHDDTDTARQKVIQAIRNTRNYGFTHFYKKTDSVLRGNIGAELEAAMYVTGSDRLHFIPAHPEMRRYTRNGMQYLGNRQLHESDFAHDPVNPVTQSNVSEVVKAQANIPVTLKEETEFKGIIIHDASSTGDLEMIADKLHKKGELRLCAGPAGFAFYLSEKLDIPKYPYKVDKTEFHGSILFVNGSAHPVALSQVRSGVKNGMEGLKITPEDLEKGFVPVRKKINSILFSAENNDELNLYRVSGVDFVKLFAVIAAKLWKQKPHTSLCISGGDTLLAILSELGIQFLQPIRNILNGVVLSGFEYEGSFHYLASKPGSYGETDILVQLMKGKWK